MDLSHAEERRDHLAVLQNPFSLRRGEEVVHPSSLDEPLQEHVVTPGLLVQVHLHRGSRAGRTGPVLGKRVDDGPAVGREGGGAYNLRRSGGVEGAGERARRAKPEPSLGGNPAAATRVRGKLGAYRSLRLGGIDVDWRDGYVHGGQGRRRLRLHLPLNLSRRRRGRRRRRGVGDHPHELRQHEPAPDRGCCRGRHDASTSRRRVVHEHLFAESLVREERRAAAGGDDERGIRRRATRENGSPASRAPAARDGSRGGHRGCQDGERATSRAQLGAVERPTPTLRREHDDGGANPGSWRGGGGDELDVPLCSQRPHHGTQRAVGDDQRVTSAPVAVHLPLLQASTGKRYEPRRVAPALRGSRPRERPDGILVGIRRVHREGIGEEAQRSLRRRHRRRAPLGRGVRRVGASAGRGRSARRAATARAVPAVDRRHRHRSPRDALDEEQLAAVAPDDGDQPAPRRRHRRERGDAGCGARVLPPRQPRLSHLLPRPGDAVAPSHRNLARSRSRCHYPERGAPIRGGDVHEGGRRVPGHSGSDVVLGVRVGHGAALGGTIAGARWERPRVHSALVRHPRGAAFGVQTAARAARIACEMMRREKELRIGSSTVARARSRRAKRLARV